MGTKDITEKNLEEYNDVFADIANVLLFQGRRVIQEKDLENSPARTMYKAEDDKIHEQERDIAKFWTRGSIRFALIGLENQSQADGDMPLRVIGYDGQSYRSQLLKDEDGEYSRDKRYPVVTMVLYFGLKPWDKAKSLYECFEIPEELKPYVNDYRINLFEIAFLSDEQVNMFQSDFKIVADYFVQMRKNNDYVASKEVMEHVDAVLKLMSVLTQDERFYEAQNCMEGEGKTMCEYLDRIIAEGETKGKMKTLISLVQDGLLNVEEAAKRAGMSVEEFKKQLNN